MTDLIEQLTAVQSHNKNDREPIQGLRKDSWLQNILDAYGNPYAWDLMKEYLQGEVNYLRGIKMLAKTYNLVIPLEDPIDEYMYEHNQHSIAEIAIDETIQRMYDTFERIHKHDTQEEYDKNVYVKSDVTEKAREMHKKIYEFSEEITPKETIYLDDGTSYESPLG
ncbi:MAG: hypothetical protein Q8O99_01735 [bacterium]|nr:hypothetical protein [bacterium]